MRVDQLNAAKNMWEFLKLFFTGFYADVQFYAV